MLRGAGSYHFTAADSPDLTSLGCEAAEQTEDPPSLRLALFAEDCAPAVSPNQSQPPIQYHD